MKEYISRYKHIIFYLIFGVLTTIINVFVYMLCCPVLKMPVLLGTIIAWIAAVTFAYITNKIWVFESATKRKKEILRELISFFSCRFLTGLIDFGCMLIFVDILKVNDMLIKTFANIVVIIFNYIASKCFVFKK